MSRTPQPDPVRASNPEPLSVSFRFAEVDLKALTWGTPGDPVAILVHGFPDSAWTWDQIGPALAARGWYVVAPFTRGYAPTSLAHNDDYSISSLVADLRDLYRAIAADSRTVIVGHDWGGAIASAATNAHPEMFARAVLISIPPLAAIKALFSPSKLLQNLPILLRQWPRSWYMPVLSTPVLSDLLGHRLVATLWRLWAPTSGLFAYQTRGLAALNSRRRLRAAFSYYRAVWNPLYRRSNPEPAAQRQAFSLGNVPTLYLQGADDTCGLERTGARALEVMPPGSRRVVVADAGHFMHLEQPDTVTQHIVDHITEDIAP